MARDGKLVARGHHTYNSGGAGIATPYNVANQIIQYHPSDSPLRQGSYRSLAAAANHFARESTMGGLAHACACDPLKFRLRNLSNPRLRAVFQTAVDKFGWVRKKSTPDCAFGIAGGTEKGDHIVQAIGGALFEQILFADGCILDPHLAQCRVLMIHFDVLVPFKSHRC